MASGEGRYERPGADLCNLVGQLGLRLTQDAGLGVVVALPGEVAG